MGLLDLLLKSDSPAKRWLNHRNLYLLGLLVIACGLAWSNALMSIGQFIIIGNWFIEFGFKRKIQQLRASPLILVLLGIFFLHVVGLLWTDDFHYAWKDIRVKLPLLALPVIMGTSEKLNLREWHLLLKVYTLTLLLLTLTSFGKYFGLWGETVIDKRQLSIYISHIRYGLNLALIVGLLFFFRPFQKRTVNHALSLWFILCLFVFQLYTGLVILIALSLGFSIRALFLNSKSTLLKFGIPIAFITIVTVFFFITLQVKNDFYTKTPLSYDQNDVKGKFSLGGEQYWSELDDPRAENGVFIRRFIAWKELEREWNKRSKLNFRQRDLKGQVLDQTLNRFLSSKGLKKDSVGISQLSDREIKAIEQGIANTYYLNHNSLENRIYNSFYQFEVYNNTANATGFSLAMRYEFWKTAKSIIAKNFWLGTGTGDIEQSFKQEYIEQNSKLDEVFRRRSHNQYLTVFATFGLIGFALFLCSLFFAPFFYNIPNKIPYLFFLGILSLSFLTEDTLESQAGVTLFAFFHCLFLLGLKQFNPRQPDSALTSS